MATVMLRVLAAPPALIDASGPLVAARASRLERAWRSGRHGTGLGDGTRYESAKERRKQSGDAHPRGRKTAWSQSHAR
jgi:hypothetical protein